MGLGKKAATKATKLDPQFKTKWLEALRSGKFKQALGSLGTEAGYCCLGVACVVAKAKFDPGESFPPSGTIARIGLTPEAVLALASQNDGLALEESGPSKRFGEVHIREEWRRAAQAARPKSFKQIANWIEKNL